MRKIDFGVFQGSVLGPLLFVIFFNDLTSLQDQSTLISIYADDNNYLLKLGEDVQENEALINRKLEQIETYMNANRLKFNASKTQLMIMNTRRSRNNNDLRLEFNGVEIKPERMAKFLGIYISDDLTWDNYIVHCEKSLMGHLEVKMRALRKMKKHCSRDQLKLLSHGLITSKILYCLPVWADMNTGMKKKIQSKLTEMYRTISNDWKSSVRTVHDNLKAFSLDGWIQYMDVMSGKNIRDFHKPEDLSDKIGANYRDERLEVRYNTRARAGGAITYTAENTSTFTPRHNSYIPRLIRTHNKIPYSCRSAHLMKSNYFEIKQMKEDLKDFIRNNQIFY